MRPITVTHKTCSKCHEEKVSDSFSRSCNYKDGLNSVCKACQAEYARNWNRNNRERFNHNKSESLKRRRRETAIEGVSKCIVYSADGSSKWCPKCKERKAIEAFTKNKDGSTRKTQSWCIDCKNEAASRRRAIIPWELRKEASRRENLKRKGITLEEYQRLHDAQHGVCAICKEFPKGMRLAVDHSHDCCIGQTTCGKCNRGLLCATCNTLLHRLEKTPGWLEKALQYLQQYKRTV